MYLTKVTVISNNHFFFKKGYTIDNLKDITLLVGDQGCGKSTMLKLLSIPDLDKISVELSDFCKSNVNGISSSYFDFEKDNPSTVSNLDMVTNPDGSPRGVGSMGVMASKFESHGETLVQYSIEGLNNLKDRIILFDEPEAALSIRHQYALVKAANTAVKNNCQLIFATHCLPLIQSQKEVFSMEHNKWMTSKEFIKTQT